VEPAELMDVASALTVNLSLLRRRLRQLPHEGEATIPEISALVRLDRNGPATNSELAKTEQISPQSMGATLAGLEERGLVSRASDPADRRRVVLSVTPAGRAVLDAKRTSRARQVADALTSFTEDDIATLRAAAPLLERLAQHL
jgi:DNA-binding MarR family transcriptional regulator